MKIHELEQFTVTVTIPREKTKSVGDYFKDASIMNLTNEAQRALAHEAFVIAEDIMETVIEQTYGDPDKKGRYEKRDSEIFQDRQVLITIAGHANDSFEAAGKPKAFLSITVQEM